MKRGSYAKFTPEQQAEAAKYASMHGITAVKCRFSKEFGTDLKESTVRTWNKKYLAEVGLKKGADQRDKFNSEKVDSMTIATQLAIPGPRLEV